MPFIQNVARRLRAGLGNRSARELHVLHDHPLNAETPLAAQTGSLTPNELFYVRDHGEVPHVDAAEWRLVLTGEFEHPSAIDLAQLRSLPARSVVVTLECAGNGRTAFRPPVPGEPWGYGAVGTAEWTGVPLHVVLDLAGLGAGARELIFTGADTCDIGNGEHVAFQRSLPIEAARDPDVLLAYAMNGEPLPPHHGFPVRLVVPHQYGVASVKWLTRIDAVDSGFDGYFQRTRYVLTGGAPGMLQAYDEPLGAMRVRAVFVSPSEGETLPRRKHSVRGLAWSGHGHIARVEVSFDGGAHWIDAALGDSLGPNAWRSWTLEWEPERTGRFVMQCRAFDVAGNGQPDHAVWNRFGYANNAVQSIVVTIG